MTPEYREYKSFEDYVTDVKKIEDYSIYHVNYITQQSQNMYEAYIDLSNNTTVTYLIIFNSKGYALSEDKFLEYKNIDKKIRKENAEYYAKGCRIYTDKCVLELEIDNKNKEDIEIKKFTMVASEGAKIYSDTSALKIEADKTQNLNIEFSSSLYFPKSFEIQKNEGNKEKIYTFEVK